MTLRKTSFGLDQFVVAPFVGNPSGPVCMTCGRLVDSESLVEGYPGESTTCKVLVKHHGAEELRTFNMGSSNWDADDLARMMTRTNWFDPTEGGLGLGRRVAADLDPEPERKPMIVVPK